MKKLIDANVIVRFLIGDDKEFFEKAKDIFLQIETGQIEVEIPHGVLLEVFFVLTKFYGIDKKEVVRLLKQIMYLDSIINEDKGEIIEALTLVEHRNVDFIDALLISRALWQDVQILTFDKKLEKVYKKLKT